MEGGGVVDYTRQKDNIEEMSPRIEPGIGN